MARSQTIKGEPAEERTIHQHCSRAQTISSNVTPAPEQMYSSGNTTVPDHDVEMGDVGANNGQILNGNASHSHNQLRTKGHDSVQSHHSPDSATPQAEDDAMQNIGANSRKLIQAIQKLEQLNIRTALPSLPKFVVVGDQSAGKSSIIEALCNITLPRSQGTCTRCPFQITTSAAVNSGTVWKCTISLFYEYRYDVTVKANKTSKTASFDRWLQVTSPEVVHFATVTSRSDLELVLRRAQLAILNPARDPSEYTNVAHPEHAVRGVAFSPNTIQLKVEAADLPELSVIDLPGSINVHEDNDEQHVVEFIASLVKSHLRDEKTMVLLTCSADQDIENSTTFRFVKQAGAIGRAMGVLTKLDLMHPNKAEQIWNMLNHKKFDLPSGSWFVTRQLSQDQVEAGVSHAEARAREQDFFSVAPWADVSKAFPEQVGIGRLQAALSKCLTSHIVQELPEIVKRVDARLTEIKRELAGLPERPRDALITVITEVAEIATSINQQIKGEGSNTTFIQEYRQALKVFQKALASTRPTVDLNSPGYEKPAFEIGSSEEETISTPTPTPMPARLAATPARTTATPARATTTPTTASKKRKADANTPIAYVETPSRRVKTEVGIQTCPRKLVFKLDGVRAQYEAGATSGLPDQPSQKVTEMLILKGLDCWDSLVDTLLTRMNRVALDLVTAGKNEVLQTRAHTELFRQIGLALERLVNDVLTEQGKLLRHVLDCELHRPITLSDMKPGNLAVARTLHKDRLKIRVDEYLDTVESQGAKITKPADRVKYSSPAQQAWVDANLGPDGYVTEITELARILNYYDLASARFADNVATNMAVGLQKRIKDGVRKALTEQLEPLDEKRCLELIAEDPKREQMRVDLLGEREKLEKAKAELEALPAQA